MSNQNAQLIRNGYAAFAQGDIATVLELFDEDRAVALDPGGALLAAGRRQGGRVPRVPGDQQSEDEFWIG